MSTPQTTDETMEAWRRDRGVLVDEGLKRAIEIERKTKALHRIYAITPPGSDVAEIARRALAGLEEVGTPEDRRLEK